MLKLVHRLIEDEFYEVERFNSIRKKTDARKIKHHGISYKKKTQIYLQINKKFDSMDKGGYDVVTHPCSNPSMKPIMVRSGNFKILGAVTGLIRRY